MEQYSFYIRRLCKCYEYQGEKARELYQEVCAEIYRSLDKFRRESSLKTWIYRITINICCKHVRKAVKESTTVEFKDAEYNNAKEGHKIIPGYFKKKIRIEEKMDRKIMLEYIIDNTSFQDRLIMILHFMGYKHNEVAEIVKLKRDNVAQRVSRIKKKAAQYMSKGDF